MSAPRVYYLGGNGHAAARLTRARAALDDLTGRGEVARFELVEAAYPGFEGRASAPSFDAFVATLAEEVNAVAPALALGTGIGGLIALCLRAAGCLTGVKLCLHAPVLWGLEKRWVPRLVRLGPLRRVLPPLFAARWYQRRFVKKQFTTTLTDEEVAAFFDGYARCAAFADMFDWLTPALLRRLERRFAEEPACLEGVTVWWGAQDRVVTPRELEVTATALGVRWPLVMFDDWAHYPMIEAPESFVRALAEAVAASEVDVRAAQDAHDGHAEAPNENE